MRLPGKDQLDERVLVSYQERFPMRLKTANMRLSIQFQQFHQIVQFGGKMLLKVFARSGRRIAPRSRILVVRGRGSHREMMIRSPRLEG